MATICSQGNQAGSDGQPNQGRALMNAEFLKQMGAVADRRLECDLQAMRDFLGRVALRDQAQHLDLARRQSLDVRRRPQDVRRRPRPGRASTNMAAFLDRLESLPQHAARFGNKLPLQSAIFESLIESITRL